MSKSKQRLRALLNPQPNLSYEQALERLPEVVMAELAGHDIDALFPEMMAALDAYPQLAEAYAEMHEGMDAFMADAPAEVQPASPTVMPQPVVLNILDLQSFFGSSAENAANRNAIMEWALKTVEQFRPEQAFVASADIDLVLNVAAEGHIYGQAAGQQLGAGFEQPLSHILVPTLVLALAQWLKAARIHDIEGLRGTAAQQPRIVTAAALLHTAQECDIALSSTEAQAMADHLNGLILAHLGLGDVHS